MVLATPYYTNSFRKHKRHLWTSLTTRNEDKLHPLIASRSRFAALLDLCLIYAKNKTTVGIGAGQMNRLDSSRIAGRKSHDAAVALGNKEPLAVGSVVASDAFFPFADGLMAAAEAGATAIIQPGGSIRDDEVIQAADEENLAMIFTGIRHFNH